jgi:hypothetical protein
MANVLYDPGREGIADRTIDLTGDVRAMLVLSSYVFSAAHKFLADLGAVDNGRTAALGTKTYTSGVFDAADISLVATAATASKALVVFQHTGSDATARVIAYIDTPTSGLPFTPAAGQTVNVTWDNGANRIFRL